MTKYILVPVSNLYWTDVNSFYDYWINKIFKLNITNMTILGQKHFIIGDDMVVFKVNYHFWNRHFGKKYINRFTEKYRFYIVTQKCYEKIRLEDNENDRNKGRDD